MTKDAMLRKLVIAAILVPLAAAIIAFAVANRQAVTVSFDPFSSAAPAYATTLPLFALIFIVLIFGVIVGGVAAWLRQGKWRRREGGRTPPHGPHGQNLRSENRAND